MTIYLASMSENRPDSQRLVNINSAHISGIYGYISGYLREHRFSWDLAPSLLWKQLWFSSDQMLISLGISSFRDCILLGLCWWSNLARMKLRACFSEFRSSLVLLLLCQLHCSTGDAGGRDTLPGIFYSVQNSTVTIWLPSFHIWKTIRHHLLSSSFIHSG